MERYPEKDINFDDYLNKPLQEAILEGLQIMSDDEIMDMANNYYQLTEDRKYHLSIVLLCHRELGRRQKTNTTVSKAEAIQKRLNCAQELYDQLGTP